MELTADAYTAPIRPSIPPQGSEMPSRPDPNLKMKTWHKSAASGLLSTQERAGSLDAAWYIEMKFSP